MIYQFANPLTDQHRLIEFLKAHHEHGDRIIAALDGLPDVVRLDCMDCPSSASIELRYNTIAKISIDL